jgi:hypothetical protein
MLRLAIFLSYASPVIVPIRAGLKLILPYRWQAG